LIRGGNPTTQVLVPAVIDRLHSYGWNSDYGNWTAIARLNPGVPIQQAQAQLDLLQRDIVRQMPPDQRDNSPDALLSLVQPLQEAIVGQSRTGLWLLLAAVSGLMLIACVNLANAQLGRAVSREREAAIRSALGASAAQILGSSLAESFLLALAGGGAGLLFASELLRLFQQLSPIYLPRMAEIHLNAPVFLFAMLLTFSSTLFFGIAPALKLLSVDPQTALQENSNRSQGSRASRRPRAWLIGVQVFACTALLLVTGLLTSSLWHLLTSDKGFNPSLVTAVQVELQNDSYKADPVRMAFDDSVLDKLRSFPGIQSAALLSALPLEGETWLDSIHIPDRASRSSPLANWRWVSPGYFETIQQSLVAGSFFEERDRNLNSVILSQSAARAVFGSESGLDRQIQHNERRFTVIGIVGDARNTSLKKAPPNMVYLHYKDNPPLDPAFLVRSTLPTDQIATQLREAIWQRDPAVTIARIKSLDSQVDDSLAPERFQAVVLIGFGLAALLLAMVGIYGVLSYSVASRKQEIGVRIALGADRQSIYLLTLAEAAAPVVGGLAAGWTASLGAGRWISSLLYGVHVFDPFVTVSVVILFILAAIVASWVPARRAVSVDPMEALRTE
jgi:predicted permease